MLRAHVAASIVAAAGISTALAAATASADWREPVGGLSPVNRAPDRNGSAPSLKAVAGVPYVAWAEDSTVPGSGNSSQIHVARLSADGRHWAAVADAGANPISYRASGSSSAPSLAEVAGRPWVAWSENLSGTDKEIRVARLNAGGTAWERVPDALRPVNHLREEPGAVADSPAIVDAGGRPYVAFFELDPGSGSLFGGPFAPARIWVMRLTANGDGWEEVGAGPANIDPAADAAFPRLAVIGGRPWIAYVQVAGQGLELRVARLADDGGGWEQIGGALTTGGFNDLDQPDLTAVDGRAVVAVAQSAAGQPRRVRVWRLNDNGDGWEIVGGGAASPSGTDSRRPSITAVGDVPWIAFTQPEGTTGSLVHVARLAGSKWVQTGGAVKGRESRNVAAGPALAGVNGFPWVAFAQDDGTAPGSGGPGCCAQERVSRLEPEFTETVAAADAGGASLLTAFETYGLPYPVGFRYGALGSSGSLIPTQEASGDPAVVVGLTQPLVARTTYWYQPFATAGTPEPPASGPLQHFITLPAQAVAGTQAQPTAGSGAPETGKHLLTAIVGRPRQVRRGRRVSLRMFVSEPALLRLRISRHGDPVTTMARWTQGRTTMRWSTRRRSLGVYRLKLSAYTTDGRSATDRASIRITRARSSAHG